MSAPPASAMDISEAAQPDGNNDGNQTAVATVNDMIGADDAATQTKWNDMDDEALQQEVLRYRTALQGLATDLAMAGITVDLHTSMSEGNDAEEQQQQQQQHLDSGLGLGEEGVDYQLGSVGDLDPSEWQVPSHCVPIHANVTTYDWSQLAAATQFDVIMMDPPWALATANPTRGVALGYSQLTDGDIVNMPLPTLQRAGGFLFVWVINAKYKFTLDLFDQWGYTLVDELVWVKTTINRRIAKSHGYYLQHAKEVCLVARKGGDPPGTCSGVGSDCIISERRGQSQKPEDIYHLIEELVPDGKYLEVFGRKNNLRNFWVTVGNEVTGMGPPKEDKQALASLAAIPGAVYGRRGNDNGG